MGLEDIPEPVMGQVTPQAPPTPESRLRACDYCGRPRLASPSRDFLHPCEGCGSHSSTLPRFPPNRVIREGEPACRTCGSGRSTHDDGTRDHPYQGPPSLRALALDLVPEAGVLLDVLVTTLVLGALYVLARLYQGTSPW